MLGQNPEFQEAFSQVRGQTTHALAMWRVYRQTTSVDETRDTLNGVAPGYFNIATKAMLRAVLLLIRNLLDPAESRVKGEVRQNASLEGLLLSAYGRNYPADAPPSLLEHIKAARNVPVVSQWVNRFIAHNDWKTTVGVEPLPVLHPQFVDDTLSEIVGFVSDMGSAFGLEGTFEFGDGDLVTQLNALVTLLRANTGDA